MIIFVQKTSPMGPDVTSTNEILGSPHSVLNVQKYPTHMLCYRYFWWFFMIQRFLNSTILIVYRDENLWRWRKLNHLFYIPSEAVCFRWRDVADFPKQILCFSWKTIWVVFVFLQFCPLLLIPLYAKFCFHRLVEALLHSSNDIRIWRRMVFIPLTRFRDCWPHIQRRVRSRPNYLEHIVRILSSIE